MSDETARTVACSIVGSRLIGLLQRCNIQWSDDDDNQIAARTEQPQQGSMKVQSDGRSTFTQIAALDTDPRAYHLQGR